MEQNTLNTIVKASYWPRMMIAVALGMLALFLLIASFGELKSYQYIGLGITPTNTISVSGTADIFAKPDTAEFSFSLEQTSADVPTAQGVVDKNSASVVAYLKDQGIDEKDIKTTDYSVNPQYVYATAVCSGNSYCPPGKQTISGYQVSESFSIKVRDTKKAGIILAGVGSNGVTNVSGLSFTVADQDSLDATARTNAIANAKAKADVLAGSLGVHLVRIIGFSEDGGGRPVPMYAKTMSAGADAAAPVAAEISLGQNKITSNVTVTYEIR